MKNFIANSILVFFLGCFFPNLCFSQFTIPKKPAIQTSVYDYVNLLSINQKRALENKLIQYSDTTSTQIVIGIIASTNGESIGLLAPRWAHKWGVGQEKEDNGVFILLAKEDRKIWISPGYGVEHKLTAGITGQIVRNAIIPQFKTGNYYQGLDNGTDAIFEVLQGVYQAKPVRSSPGNEWDYFALLFFVALIILFIIISRGDRGNKGGRGYRDTDMRDIFDTIILSNAGRGGWSSGGSSGGWSSGGGFDGGFGGGGFSGGGAGGSW